MYELTFSQKPYNSAENYVFSNKKIKNEMEIFLESTVGISYRILKVIRQNAAYNYCKWSLISTNLKTAGEMREIRKTNQRKMEKPRARDFTFQLYLVFSH